MLWDRCDPNGYAHRMTTDPAARHPAAPGAAGRRLRRPPGHQLAGRRRGAHDRRRRARPDRSTPAAGRASTSSGASRGSAATRSVARRSSTGTSARSARTEQSAEHDRHRTATAHQHCPTAPARTRTWRRAPRSPSSSWSPSFLQPNGVIVNTCGTGPATRGPGPVPRGFARTKWRGSTPAARRLRGPLHGRGRFESRPILPSSNS